MSKSKSKKAPSDLTADEVIRKIFTGKVLRQIKRNTSEKKKK